MTRFSIPGALLCALMLLSACDDPTEVGGELINPGPNAGPQRVELPLAVEEVDYSSITGSSSPTVLGVSRILAGQTSGGPFGDVKATGYVDFERAGAFQSVDLTALSLDTVEVRLAPEYFYGDTTRATTLALYDLQEEWDADGATADTALADDAIAENTPITTFSVAASDTLTTVQLPRTWIREHASELLAESDSTVADEFHGLQIRATDDAGGVVGFPTGSISIRATYQQAAGTGEATFRPARQLTTVGRLSPRTVPEERSLIQGGIGRSIALEFDFPDSLRGVAVNSATFIFEVDTTTAAGGDFQRPEIDALELYAVPLTDDGEVDEDQDPVRQNGLRFPFDADESRFVNGFPLIDLVQGSLLGTSDLERFQVRPATRGVQTPFGNAFVSVPSLDSRLIRRDEGHEPRLVLTYMPTDED